jgi:predicted phage-related endonuclease
MELRAEEKKVKNEAEAIKNKVKSLLGEAKTGKTDGWQATWTLQSRTTFDSRRFKEEEAETYDKYTKTGEFKVFRFKELKKKVET